MKFKTSFYILIPIFIFYLHSAFYVKNEQITDLKSSVLNQFIIEHNQQLINALKDLNSASTEMEFKRHYFEARKAYKTIEFFVEHVSPIEAKYRINGPLVPKYNEYDERIQVDPQGMQQIEAFLFESDTLNDIGAKKETTKLIEIMQRLNNQYLDIQLSSEEYLEMLQLQLFRLTALNLNGYDATFTKINVQEAIWNLEGMSGFLDRFQACFKKQSAVKKSFFRLQRQIDSGIKILEANKDFESFDRLAFTMEVVEKINQELVTYHNTVGLPWTKHKRALNLQNGYLFREESLNKQFFSSYFNDTLNLSKQIALGKILFYDPILSGNNERACASCHQPNKAFTDGMQTSLSFDKEHTILRNAPSLIDVVYQKAFFYDGKAYQLEQQISEVVHNEQEMGSNLNYLVDKLRLSETYKNLFSQAFNLEKDKKISIYAIQKALSEYEKTLVSFNSRFDQYLRGNTRALTTEERLGYNLFAGKALCATCHFFPVFNGTVPPFYMDSEYEILGVPETAANNKLDADFGRYVITKANFQKYAFKTPTIRNSALTAPYMHNGVYTNLKQVLEFYQKGGGKGLKYDVPNQTLPFDTLKLNAAEQTAIIRFLESLTDTSGLMTQPFKLPQFQSNPTWNDRVWGGKY